MKKAIIVYNAISKPGEFHRKILLIVDNIIKKGYEVEIYPTQKQNDIFDKIKLANNIDLIVCAGGDGTLNEVINAKMMYINNKETEVLYFPTGTVNDFAYNLQLNKKIKKTLNYFNENKKVVVDTGKINDLYFNYVATIGYLVDSSYKTSQKAKNLFGEKSYVLNGLRRLNQTKNMYLKINLDDQFIEGDFILCMISQSKSVAGVRNLFPNNKIDDGYFGMLLLKKDLQKEIINIPKIIKKGITSDSNTGIVMYRQFKHATIEVSDDICWNVDGEKGPKGKVEISMINKNIAIYGEKS